MPAFPGIHPFTGEPARRTRRKFVYRRPWLYAKQSEAIFDPLDCRGVLARYSLIEASTKSGKTVGCIIWLFEQAFNGKRGQNFWWIAPVFGQAEIAFRRMKRAIPQEIFTSTKTPLKIELLNGATIWFKSAENPDNLYGEDVFAAVVDEASRVREEAWHAIRSTLTATRGPVRIIGNVKGRRNWFYRLCRRAQAGSNSMSYHKLIAADAIAAGILADEEVEDARDKLPEAVFRELYLAEASDDQGNPFGFADIEACVIPTLSPDPVVAWGWDLGKKRNWTVGVGLDAKGRTARFERFQRPWPETIRTIRSVVGSTPAKIDSTGVGDPVLDALQTDSLGINFEGFLFTGPSKQKLMEGLAVDIQSQQVGYPEGPIKSELESFEYNLTRTGVRYACPEGFHDDCVDALALASAKRKEVVVNLNVWGKL